MPWDTSLSPSNASKMLEILILCFFIIHVLVIKKECLRLGEKPKWQVKCTLRIIVSSWLVKFKRLLNAWLRAKRLSKQLFSREAIVQVELVRWLGNGKRYLLIASQQSLALLSVIIQFKNNKTIFDLEPLNPMDNLDMVASEKLVSLEHRLIKVFSDEKKPAKEF